MRILIVDDASFVRMALGKILEEDNHEIVGGAANGEEAIEKYKLLKPDLVTMDITMPGMSGIECLEKILEIDPNAKVIMCSAMGHQQLVMKAIQCGALDFIVKPFDNERVKEAIRRYKD